VSDRANRSLVTLAALARVNDEGSLGFVVHHDKHPEGVGTLTESGKTSVLTAREACNKTIHAKFAQLHLRRDAQHPIQQDEISREFSDERRMFLRPTMQLAGDRANGKEWEAMLDIVQWVHAVLNYSNAYGVPLLVERSGREE
jgi:hypothetical protein